MTLKTTLRSLSFVLAASVSSFALAQGLGVGLGADAHVGTGSIQAGAGAQASGDARAGSQHGASEARIGAEGDASINPIEKKAKKPKRIASPVSGNADIEENTSAQVNTKSKY